MPNEKTRQAVFDALDACVENGYMDEPFDWPVRETAADMVEKSGLGLEKTETDDGRPYSDGDHQFETAVNFIVPFIEEWRKTHAKPER